MQNEKSARISPVARWICFLVLVAGAAIWAANSVLARAGRMKTADTSAQAFSTVAPGTHFEAVVKIDQVNRKTLKCTALEKVNDTTFRRPRTGGSTISVALTPGTSFVMGTAQDVSPGAIVQIAGTVTADHVLIVSRIVILTGYVRLTGDPQPQ